MLGISFLDGFIEKKVKRQTVADTVDHLNYYFTAYLLGFCSIAVSSKQYFGSPIECWMPSHFKDEWEEYVESFCFSSMTYHVPMNKQIPEKEDERSNQISYYRWVPVVLAIQSVMFVLPNYFWNLVHMPATINFHVFLKAAESIMEIRGDQRTEEIKRLAKYFLDTVSIFGESNYHSKYRRNLRSGTNAMLLYLLTKFFYILNIGCQGVLLSSFIGKHYFSWGYETVVSVFNGYAWTEAPVFPRVILCNFKIRVVGNIQDHTVQCVIMMNTINEKIYLFLFVWFFFLALVNIASFLYYLAVMLLPTMRTRLVMFNCKGEKKAYEKFVAECLHPDGILLLQFVTEHVGQGVTMDLVSSIYALYVNTEIQAVLES